MYKVKLSKAVRLDGKRRERGEKVEVSDEQFRELQTAGAVEEAEEMAEVVAAASTATGKGRGAAKATAADKAGE